MNQYSEEDVREALSPYHGLIRQAVISGFNEWLAVSSCRTEKGFSAVLYPRTVTNYVFDAITRNARKVFGKDPSVRVIDEAQTAKYCFGAEVVGRFKKGDEDRLGQNIPTQAALDFASAQQPLPGMPPEAAKVEFVWVANDIGTEIESILVVARDGDTLLWSYEIDDAGTLGGIVPFPSGGDDEPDDDVPLVKPRTHRPANDDTAGD